MNPNLYDVAFQDYMACVVLEWHVSACASQILAVNIKLCPWLAELRKKKKGLKKKYLEIFQILLCCPRESLVFCFWTWL